MLRKRLGRVAAIMMTALLFNTLTCPAQATHRYENRGLGTMDIRSQAIGQSLRLTLPIVAPGDIQPGLSTYIGGTWTNVWANDSEFLLDYETLDILARVSYGFNNTWGVALIYDNRSFFGGAMDGFIEGFHDLFGISQDGRDEVPSNRSIITFDDPTTGETVEFSADKLDNSGASLLLNYTPPLPSGWPGINIYGVVRQSLNSADVFEESGNTDYGLGIGIASPLSDDWHAYAVAGYTIYANRGKTSPGNVAFYEEQFTGMLALTWQFTSQAALVGQYLYSGATIKSFASLNEPSHEIHLGVKWRIGERFLLQAALLQNIINFDNTPDFGLHLGFQIGL